MKKLLQRLLAWISYMPASAAMRPAHEACPCLHTTPCDPRCTCVHGGSSVGCRRCCTYGSKQQQRARAVFLADVIDHANQHWL